MVRPPTSGQVRPIAKLAPYIDKIFARVFFATYALCNGCSYLERSSLRNCSSELIRLTSFVDLLCFCSVLCLLCLCTRLFICALWPPAGKGLTSLLSFVVSNCEFVTFPLVPWVRCGT